MNSSLMQRRARKPSLRTAVLITTVVLLLTDVLSQHRSYAQGMPGQPPTAGDDFAFTESTEDISINILSNDYGVSAPIDPTSVTILAQTETGSASFNAATGNIDFIPYAGSEVSDFLIYEVSDEDGHVSNPAFVWIYVFHFPPAASDDSGMLSYVDDITIDVLSNDSDGTAPIDTGSVTIVTLPTNGIALVDSTTGEVTYIPNMPSSGTDSFDYVVADVYGNESNVASVELAIINMPPAIISFTGTPDIYGNWLFEGDVQDERPETTTVEFGGVISGSVTPDESGHFEELFSVSQGTYGYATATATDELGQQSDTVEVPVSSY